MTKEEESKTVYEGICYSTPLPTRSFFYDESIGINTKRIKTIHLILTLCLNIGTDSPDQIKQKDSASKECWIDTAGKTNRKLVYDIAANLTDQYRSWQNGSKIEPCCDPTYEDVRRLCLTFRRMADTDRILFHYNGHGVPLPTLNGEIWFFDKEFTQYIPLQIYELLQTIGTPSIYIFDCSCAGRIITWCKKYAQSKQKKNKNKNGENYMFLGSCQDDEMLPTNPFYPADLFTSCLTTPLRVAVLYYIQNSLLMKWDATIIDRIPGVLNNRRTPLGELNWIFTAITDSIAWNVLPRPLFYKLFRQDLLIASLYRNFFLAQRVMQSLKCKPISYPILPDASNHYLWVVWDRALELCLLQINNHCNSFNESTSSFFDEQLVAFEVWLESDNIANCIAAQLPILLQVLLSQTLRERALKLLCRFLDLGPWACDQALAVGIFPYILKLLSSTTSVDFYEYLVFCWMKILVVDKKKTFHQNLIRENHQIYFLNVLKNNTKNLNTGTNAYALFILTTLLEDNTQVKATLVQSNIIEVIHFYFKSENIEVRSWALLCLSKLWEGSVEIKIRAQKKGIINSLMLLLQDPNPRVRVALLNCLTTLIGEPYADIGEACNEIALKTAVLVHDACPKVREHLIVLYQRLAKVLVGTVKESKIFEQTVEIGKEDPDTDVNGAAEILNEILEIYTNKEEGRTITPQRRINGLNTIVNKLYESRVYELSQPLLKKRKEITPQRKWFKEKYVESRTQFTLIGSDFENHKLKQIGRFIGEEGHEFNAGNMIFHPTLPLLVVGSNKGSTIRVFDTNSESVVNAWNNFNSGNKSISGMTWINKTDIPMLVTSSNDGAIRIWRNWEDSGSNVLVSSFKGVMEECLPDIGAKVVGLGESRLLTAGNSMIRIWDLEKEELEANIRMKTSITCVNEYNEFSDHMFLVGNVNGKVTLYDMRLSPQEREVKTWKISHSPIITTSRPSSGNTIIAGAVARLNEPSLAGLIDIRASQIRKLYVPKLTTLVTHPTATYFVCGSAEQFIRSYNSESGKMIQEIKYYDGFFGHRINPVVNMAITQFGFNTAVSSTDSSITLFGFD
ncbi:hypothetical protein ENUP19_0187G0006 [Entamoeba nuttalli]